MSGMRSFKNGQIQHDGGKTPDLSVFQHQIGNDNSFGGEKRARNFLKMGVFGLALTIKDKLYQLPEIANGLSSGAHIPCAYSGERDRSFRVNVTAAHCRVLRG